jgi:hypothetical protein
MRREGFVGVMVAHGKGVRRWTFICLGQQEKWPWHRTLGMKDLLYKETQAKKGSDDLPGIDIKTRSKHSYDLIVQKNEDPRKKVRFSHHSR